MSFKTWFFSENMSSLGGLVPPKENPEELLRKYKGAMPVYNTQPLPGNKKLMKKLMKKK